MPAAIGGKLKAPRTHRRSMLQALLTLATCAGMTACVLPPREAAHPAPLSNTHVGLNGQAVEPVMEDWWTSFQDPQLDRLMRSGLKDSPVLRQAQARVVEAIALTQATQATLLPNVNLGATAQYQRAAEHYQLPPPLAGHSFWSGQAGASLTWELDFWGKQAAAIDSAAALEHSARLDVETARLLLAGAIATTYVEYYRETALAEIAQRSADQRANIVAITRRRVAAGLDTQLELKQAEGQLPQARVAREQAQAAAQISVHELAILTGQGAESYTSLQRPALNVEAAIPIPTALPINLLARRPDVLSARLRITAADSQRRADKAAFYPSVNLNALAGFGAFGINNLLQWSARGYSVGPVVSLPLFDGGLLRAQYTGSEARLDESIEIYNNTVLYAVRQAADQLTRIEALAQERQDQQLTLDANEAAYKLAEERYRAGLASYLSVLNAETQVLTARQTVVDIIASQIDARVTLLLAVGGNFDPERTIPMSKR